jgi:hypothetical protein
MKTKILGCIVALGVVTGSFISCTEPQAQCLVEDASAGAYIVQYIVQGTAPACSASILLPGEQVGMSFFHPAVTNSDGSVTFDATIGHVAIQGNAAGTADEVIYGGVGIADTTPGDEPYAYGRFKSPLPDANDFCYVVTDQGITCTAAGAKCSVDEDCCNGQCNIPANFTCQSDTDCPTGTTCGCDSDPTTCMTTGGTCTGPSLCASLLDNLTSQQSFTAATDTAAGKTTIGMACNAAITTGSCTADAATCTASSDCCSGTCTAGACAAGMDVTCAGGPMAMSNAVGVVCDPTQNLCVLGCRGTGGNTCDASFACSSTDATIGSCALPAESISYGGSNVDIYTTAAAQGTQFMADLAFTQTVSGAPCTINYKALGLWPAVACEGADAMGNPNGMPDDDLCNPCSEPSEGRAVGSGINFQFPIHCDPTLLTCVLVDEASYAPNASDLAMGVLSSGTTKPATTIPELMPAGDARIPVCQGE